MQLIFQILFFLILFFSKSESVIACGTNQCVGVNESECIDVGQTVDNYYCYTYYGTSYINRTNYAPYYDDSFRKRCGVYEQWPGSASGTCGFSVEPTCYCKDYGSYVGWWHPSVPGTSCVGTAHSLPQSNTLNSPTVSATSLGCNASQGWYSTCSSGNCTTSLVECFSCGNTEITCYKAKAVDEVECSSDSQCGSCNKCVNSGLPTSYCTSDSSQGSCGNTDGHCSGTAYTGTCGKSCTGTASTAGVNGVCGGANGGSYCNNYAPNPNGLSGVPYTAGVKNNWAKCQDGTDAGVSPGFTSTSDANYTWICPGSAGTCGGSNGSSATCTATNLAAVAGSNASCGGTANNGPATCLAPTTNLCGINPTTGSSFAFGVYTDQSRTDGDSDFGWTCLGGVNTCGYKKGTDITTCTSPTIPTDEGKADAKCFDSTTSNTDGFCDADDVINRCQIGEDAGDINAWAADGVQFSWTCRGKSSTCDVNNRGAPITCTAQNKITINETMGTCGVDSNTSPKKIFINASEINLKCNYGWGSVPTASSAEINPDSEVHFNWSCTGDPGQCNSQAYINYGCWAIKDTAPYFISFDVKDVNDNPVIGEDITLPSGVGVTANHICQSDFDVNVDKPDTVRFEVTFGDPQQNDIGDIKLKLGTEEFSPTKPIEVLDSYSVKATFDIKKENVVSKEINQIVFSAKDKNAVTLPPDYGTGRYFKFWDCLTGIEGRFYNGSMAPIITCEPGNTNIGFSSFVYTTGKANITSMAFESNDLGSRTMNLSSTIGYNSTEKLTWGKAWVPSFNNDANFYLDLAQIRTPVSNDCIPADLGLVVDKTYIDPYSQSSIDIGMTDIDFSIRINESAWWQTFNGGVVSNNGITSKVPTTCPPASSCNLSVGISNLVSSSELNIIPEGMSKESVFSPLSYEGESAKLVDNTSYSYKYFYDQYFVKNGIGITAIDMDGIGDSGIYFVDGDLNINRDAVNPLSNYLMIVVNGDIGVSDGVQAFNGVLVANNINIGGSALDVPLNIEGSLYAVNSVNLFRSFLDKGKNNIDPAIRVTYNPKIIIELLGKISTKVLTNWQWGN